MNSFESLEARQLLSHVAPPVAPTDLSAVTDGQAATIRLYWKNNTSKATGEIVQARRSRSEPWQTLAALPAGTVYFRSGHLAAGRSYAYRVFAFNGGGTSAAATASATTYTVGMPFLDTGFGNNGQVSLPAGTGGSLLAISPDGEAIYALSKSGTSATISELSSSGATLATFAAPFADVQGMTVQSDGKLVVAGNVGTAIGLARFNADGSLDTTFNGSGQYQHDYGGGETVVGVAVDSHGAIYVGGGDYGGTPSEQQFFAVRLTAGGTLDADYGNGGIVLGGGLADFGNLHRVTNAQAMTLYDDVPLVAGAQDLLDGLGIGSYEFESVLMEPNGRAIVYKPDVPAGKGETIHSVIVDGAGRPLAVGYDAYGESAEATRLTSGLAVDASWVGPTELMTFETLFQLDGVAQLPDGSYVAVGTQDSDDFRQVVGSILHLRASDGAIIGGITRDALPGSTQSTSLSRVVVDSSGDIYTLGSGPSGLALFRYRV